MAYLNASRNHLGEMSPMASPSQMVSDVDQLHLQMLHLHEQVRDYDMDSASEAVSTPMFSPHRAPNGAASPAMSPHALHSRPGTGRAIPVPGGPPAGATTAAPPHSELTDEGIQRLGSVVHELQDDDIDALYHSIRQTKIQSVVVEPAPALSSPPPFAPPPLPENVANLGANARAPTASANDAMASELAVLRAENAALRDDLAHQKDQVAALGRERNQAMQQHHELAESVHHIQRLFDEAHHDNQAKHQRIAGLEDEVERLRAELHGHEVDLALQRSPVASPTRSREADAEPSDIGKDLGSEMSRLRNKILTLEAENEALTSQVQQQSAPLSPRGFHEELRAASALSGDSSATDDVKALTPSQLKSLDRALAQQLDKERAQFAQQVRETERFAREADAQRRKVEAELEAARAELRESERARYQVRLADDNPDNELEAYRVHVNHLKSLLQKQLGSRDVAETVSELSLKLSYWSVLRDVYEETFEELIRAKGLQAPTDDDPEQE